MLHIVNLEEIQSLLLRLPELINNFERRNPSFASAARDWLTQAEQVLVNNRLAVAADVAVLRGVLISAERGAIPSGLAFSGRVTSRKIRDASAADVLKKAEELIADAIRGTTAQLEEGERLTRQLLAVAQRKGLLPAGPHSGEHTEMLKGIWHAMTVDPDLGSATTHLAGLIGVHNALILLDRGLARLGSNVGNDYLANPDTTRQ